MDLLSTVSPLYAGDMIGISPKADQLYEISQQNDTNSADFEGEYFYANISFGDIKTVPPWKAALKIFFTAVIMLVSLVGNFMVVFVVMRNKRMRTTTNFYIVNLAVADLLITLCCTWVKLVDDLTPIWGLGSFFCRFNSFAQIVVSVSSILTLMLIACDRFFGIIFAMKAHMTERRASVFIVLVWIVSTAVASPLLRYRKTNSRKWLDHHEIWCSEVWPTTVKNGSVHTIEGKRIYNVITTLFLFFIPIIVMAVAYVLIIRRLWSSRIPGEQLESENSVQDKVKKKVVVMLIIILSVFTICWLPLQVSILYIEFKPADKPYGDWYEEFTFFASFMAFSNSALNPIIYAGFNENFRKGMYSVTSERRLSYGNTVTTRVTGANKTKLGEIV
ncbi:QRFP-like peptide receptor isoform X2 [Tubulanus polymorphus]|uniref:QRFP-like peptide receptor isoform X2 n=1 Tax=Tubulanus polymorphus TaxID=672921 RepID=UPI003DA2C754